MPKNPNVKRVMVMAPVPSSLDRQQSLTMPVHRHVVP